MSRVVLNQKNCLFLDKEIVSSTLINLTIFTGPLLVECYYQFNRNINRDLTTCSLCSSLLCFSCSFDSLYLFLTNTRHMMMIRYSVCASSILFILTQYYGVSGKTYISPIYLPGKLYGNNASANNATERNPITAGTQRPQQHPPRGQRWSEYQH